MYFKFTNNVIIRTFILLVFLFLNLFRIFRLDIVKNTWINSKDCELVPVRSLAYLIPGSDTFLESPGHSASPSFLQHFI